MFKFSYLFRVTLSSFRRLNRLVPTPFFFLNLIPHSQSVLLLSRTLVLTTLAEYRKLLAGTALFSIDEYFPCDRDAVGPLGSGLTSLA